MWVARPDANLQLVSGKWWVEYCDKLVSLRSVNALCGADVDFMEECGRQTDRLTAHSDLVFGQNQFVQDCGNCCVKGDGNGVDL